MKAGAVLGMLLVSLVFLCRGVSLGHFAVPVPILSLFTKSCCVCIKRSPCLCVYVKSFEDSKLFCHLLLLLCFITAQEMQVNVSIVSECITVSVRQGNTAWCFLTLTSELESCDKVELISQPAARRGGLGPSLSSAISVFQMMPQQSDSV